MWPGSRIKNVEVIYYKESPSLGIRYSYVLIPGKVKEEVRKAISEAQQALRIKIQQVIVGLPRWYVRQETASASMTRPEPDDLIQESEIKALKSMALESYPLEDSTKEVIYGAVAQSFSTEDSINEPENDIVGMAAETLEGNFKVFIGNRRYSSNIDSVFNDLGIAIAKKYFTPGITAKAVLKSEQMENGVALIDIGAGVSSVTIFKDKIMRFYAAIPFGGNSVTNDIKSECNFSFELAENIKKAYGACMPNKLSSLGEKSIQIVDEDGNTTAQVSVKYISEIDHGQDEGDHRGLAVQDPGKRIRIRGGSTGRSRGDRRRSRTRELRQLHQGAVRLHGEGGATKKTLLLRRLPGGKRDKRRDLHGHDTVRQERPVPQLRERSGGKKHDGASDRFGGDSRREGGSHSCTGGCGRYS